MARTGKGFYPAYTESGNSPAIGWFTPKASTAYREGAVLQLTTTPCGNAVYAAEASTAALGVCAISTTTPASPAANSLPVYLANNDTVFKAYKNVACVVTAMRGRFFDIDIEDTHTFGVCTAASTKVLKCLDSAPGEPTGSSERWYLVKFAISYWGQTVKEPAAS